MAMKPLSARRARTRERLIDAASQVIGEKGLEGATLDEIATRVGLTKGAIYDNFESKDDLILAVIMLKAANPQRPQLVPGGSLKEQLAAIGRSLAAFMPAAEAQASASAQLDVYALAHEGMRTRLSGFYARRITMGEAFMTELAKEHELPMPPDQFAIMLSVLAAGLIQHRLMTPQLVTDDFIVKAFEALAPDS